MKIFGWMQSKLNGRQTTKKPTTGSSSIKNQILHEPCKEEFSDWPHGLLAIGTFGNGNVKEEKSQKCGDEIEDDHHDEENPSSLEDQLDFTPEEIGKLQKELTKLLSRKPATESQRRNGNNLPLDKFLNCPSSLEVDRTICEKFSEDLDDKEVIADIRRSISVVLGKGKDVSQDGSNGAIKKKSISFLLKKMFVCSSGFAPTPSLRDQLQLPESRMEKLLRAILHKKIQPRSSTATSTKKYLENNRYSSKKEIEDQTEEKGTQIGSKWDKTDSEYIVLEI